MTTDLLDTPDAGPAAVRGGAIRVAGYAAGVLISVASAALLFRHLGVAEGGRYALVISIATIAVGLTEAGLSGIGVREIVQGDPASRVALLRNLLGLRIVLSLGGIAVACGYAALAGYDDRLVIGAALAGIATLVQGVQAILTVALQADLRFGAVAAADLVRQITNVAAIVVLVLVGAGLLPFFAALIVAGIAGVAIAALLARQSGVPLVPAFDLDRWLAFLRLTLPFALATAVAVVYLRIGLLLLDKLSDERQTGLYGVSFRVIEVASVVPALAIGAAFPIFSRAARGDASRLLYAVQRTFDSSLAFGALISVTLFAGAATVIDVVGGDKFAEADGVLRWHAVALMGTFAAHPFGFALLAAGRTRGILAITLGALAVSVGATLGLVPRHGAEGAAAAAAAAEWALALGGAVLLARAGTRVSLAGAAKVLVAVPVALAPMLLLPPLAAAVAAAGLFSLLLVALRALPRELLDALLQRR